MNKQIYNGFESDLRKNNELILYIGHYVVVNSNAKLFNKQSIVVYGLGSCIVPILMDKKNKVFGISHILVPYAYEKNSIAYPHKYANLSIKNLVEEMVNHGVEIKNICAIIIGGANIFQGKDCVVGQENIKVVKNELEKFNIQIIKEDIGGNKGRIVKFNTIDFSINVKVTGNDNFKLL